MITVNNILEFLTNKYPLDTAIAVDNVGLLTGDKSSVVTKAVVCLDCDINAVDFARKENINLIITHHPVIFDGLKTVTAGSVAYELVKSGISVISMHTNLDIAKGGVTENLCKAIGLTNVSPFAAHNDFLIREADCSIKNADALAERIKQSLGGSVRYADSGREICRVLVCSGSGGDFLSDVIDCGYDALIAADIKHNVFIDALNHGVTVFDAGHYQSENVIVEPLCRQLENEFVNVKFCTFDNIKIKSV